MSAANELCVLVLAFAVAACGTDTEQPANNTVVDASTDIETLPPDESLTTPTPQLRNGAAEPQVNETSRNGS